MCLKQVIEIFTKCFIAFTLVFSQSLLAQERLTLQDAVAKTMKHNFDINTASATEQIAINNNTYGNAGFLPTVAFSGTATGSINHTHNDLANGTVQKNPHAKVVNYNPAALVAWTLYDGGKMFLLKKQLEETVVMNEFQLKAQIQTMVSRTIQMYAQVVWQQKQVSAIDTALALAKTRMDISYMKYQNGASPKIDFLQARVDYNSRQSDSLAQISTLTKAFDSLNVLMGENEDRNYIVDDTLSLDIHLEPSTSEKIKTDNLSLNVFKKNASISDLNAKMATTYSLPNVSFSGGYVFSQTSNSTGYATFSQSFGPTGSFNITVPLYMGGNLRRQVKVASLQAFRDELLYEKQNTVIGRQYHYAWRNYQLSVAAYNLELESIKYAKENLSVEQARFKVGVATSLEARQAENDFVTAMVRLYTAEYNLKVNETIVLELENKLIR